MAAAVFRGRSLKSRRLRAGRQENVEENVTLDYSKAPSDNLQEVLTQIVKQDGVSRSCKLGSYNAFVRFIYRHGVNFATDLSKTEILCCLRLGLLHDAKEIRAAALRAIRYYCQDEETIMLMVKLHIDYLIAKSIDICLDNEVERIHALRLSRKLMSVCPARFPLSLLNAIQAIASDGAHERDRMLRTSLATICELALLRPDVSAHPGLIGCILRNVLDCHQMPRINESLLATVLYLLNHPRTRCYIRANVDLEQLLAAFTDFHSKPNTEKDSTQSEEKENKFAASKMAIVTAMKSWPGIIRLCKPDGTGLQSLIGVLFLPNMETRKEIMDIFFDVFHLTLPEWTDDFSKALLSIDISSMRESWMLTEGFVAEEGKILLPHLSKTRPNLMDNHIALLLSTFISAGLLEALVEVVTTSEQFTSIRATILLGELLHMASSILPHECAFHSHCLPTLMSLAASFDVPASQCHLASQAVSCLEHLATIKKRGVLPCSLYLDHILQISKEHQLKNTVKISPLKPNRDALLQCFDSKWPKRPGKSRSKESDKDVVAQAIKDSQVLNTKDNFTWDWNLISAILKWPDKNMFKAEEQSSQKFVKRLLFYFKPSSRLFSTLELGRAEEQRHCTAMLYFVDFFLENDDEDMQKYADEFLRDLTQCLSQIRSTPPGEEAIFGVSSLTSTCAQYYFLFIGRFSSSIRGEKMLEAAGIYQNLLDLMTLTAQDTYIKLIVSCLDFSRGSMSRIILSKGLTATSESARLYTASMLRILLRARIPLLENWAMEMLVNQLYDQSVAVAMEALSVISEACEEEVNLQALVNMRPSVLHLGYKGGLLLARFLSIPNGLQYLSEANYIQTELEKWHKYHNSAHSLVSYNLEKKEPFQLLSYCDNFNNPILQWFLTDDLFWRYSETDVFQSLNVKYVHIIEERLNEALTTYEKSFEGSYVRRSQKRLPRKDVFIPVHLYGQLVQHKQGFNLLESQEYLVEYFNIIRYQELKTDEQVLRLKTALWAVGHMGTSVWGINLLQEQNIIPEIIKLAEECGVFSIRGTAYYVLGLISSTIAGSTVLRSFLWESVRHHRSELWPVFDPDCVPDSNDVEDLSSASSLSINSRSKFFPSPVGSAHENTHPLVTVTVDDTNAGRSSPHSYGSSSKALFFIGGDEMSPSNTASDTSGRNSLESKSDSLPRIKHQNSSSSDQIGGHARQLEKDQSSSMPLVVKKTDIVQHPRSQSDPARNVVDKHTETQNVVHFEDEVKDEEGVSQIKSYRENVARKRTPNNSETPIAKSELMGIKPRSGSLREDKSGSDSARTTPTTGKSRSDSINTDTTTSGVGSFDSGPQTGYEPTPLTPIPSASSVATDGGKTYGSSQDSDISAHASDVLRKLANLKRVPSMKRRFSNPVLGHVSLINTGSLDRHINENWNNIPSGKNVQGMATLRQIQKQRTTSSIEIEEHNKLDSIHEEAVVTKTRSLDFRLWKSSSSKRLSSASLADLEVAGAFTLPLVYDTGPNSTVDETLSRNASWSSFRNAKSAHGKAEYIGIALPVDITMLYQVHEGEDRRSLVNLPAGETQHQTVRSHKALRTRLSQSDDDGLEIHTPHNCLGCCCLHLEQEDSEEVEGDVEDTFAAGSLNSADELPSSFTNVSTSGGSIISAVPRALGKSRHSSLSELLVSMPASVGSTTSMDSAAVRPLVTEESQEGLRLIRKEILSHIVRLSGSVGTKSAEQGLLILRQKFPKAFQNICLYSEICHLLSHYNFRLSSRRFIQELFLDVDYSQLFEHPFSILGIVGSYTSTVDPLETDTRLELVLESIS